MEARFLRAKVKVGFVDDYGILEAELQWGANDDAAGGTSGIESITWDEEKSQVTPSKTPERPTLRLWRIRIRTVVVMGLIGLAANLANMLSRF